MIRSMFAPALLATGLLLSGCAVIQSVNIRMAEDGKADLDLVLLTGKDDETGKTEIKQRIEKCGGTPRELGSDDESERIAAKFQLSGSYDFDRVFQCAGGKDDRQKPSYTWSRSDGVFSTNYALTITIPLAYANSMKEIRVAVPVPVTDVKVTSQRFFASTDIQRIGDDTIVFRPKVNFGPMADDCGVALDPKGAPQKGTSQQNDCIDKAMEKAMKTEGLTLNVQASKSKVDLAILVALIGAVLGSGLLVNLINVAVRKRAEPPRH